MRGQYKLPYSLKVETEDGRGLILREYHFDSRRLLHRDPEEGPAFIERYLDGSLSYVKYVWHGLLHRDGGPARLSYGTDGFIVNEEWCRFNLVHRDPRDGPAIQTWLREGEAEFISYSLYGYPFRDPREGPYGWSVKGGKITGERFTAETPPRPKPPLSWLRETYGPVPFYK
jgi:hypothetical protein